MSEELKVNLEAAAPALYAALARAEQYLHFAILDCEGNGHSTAKETAEWDLKMVQAALAKARGKQ